MRTLFLLIVVIQACHALRVETRQSEGSGDEDCIEQEVVTAEVEYEEQLQCRHLPQETCMQTMSTKYKTTKDEECKDTFTKDCYIEYINVPKSAQVETCVTPWRRDCDAEGERECTTEFETICETIYHEDEVDDDIANCVTEVICKNGDAVCAPEEQVPKRSCTVEQEPNKKYTKETECKKEPREVCGPESCPLIQDEKECSTETKTFVQQQPEENCDLVSRKVCTPTMKVVPSMEPVTKCVNMGKEICEYVKLNPQVVKKTLKKKICEPIVDELLEEGSGEEGSGDEPGEGSDVGSGGDEGSGAGEGSGGDAPEGSGGDNYYRNVPRKGNKGQKRNGRK